MPITFNRGAGIHWQPHGPQDSPAVVLLHSIGTDLSIYDEVVPLLEGQLRVIAMDLRGHGQSQATQEEYSLELLSHDVLAVLDEAGIDRAIVCGTSLGAMIAMKLVQLAPDRVSGLVLANTSPGMSPALWPERIKTVREQGVGPVLVGWAARHLSEGWMSANPERVETLERGFAGMDPLGYIGSAAAIRDMDVIDGLPKVTAPTMIVAGQFDIATPYQGHADRIAAAMATASVEFLPTGHLACMERPELFANCVLALARRCE